MNATPTAPERDPEFVSAPAERLVLYDPEPQYYQRLLANPFLSACAVILWIALFRLALGLHIPPVMVPVAIAVVVVTLYAPFWLLQYHCLDCGGTGRIARWREHACPSVLQRRRERRIRRFRGPTPPIQIVLWLWVILALGLFYLWLGWMTPD